MLKLPIGQSDFRSLIEGQQIFIDKSLFIKDIMDDATVILITRPRRFGKTLNLSMLRYFFATEVYGQNTQGLFDGLNIMKTGATYLQHQGKYPVIFLTFKDIKDGSFAITYKKIQRLMSDVYEEYSELESSSKLSAQQKERYRAIVEERADEVDLQTSIKDLTYYLYCHYQVKPVILLDEYDTPIQDGYLHDYYEKIITFMRGFFSTALKDNNFLYKAVLTGIVRVSKESLFSGLNNLKVYSVLSARYGEYFGFSEAETNDLLSKAKLKTLSTAIKDWYNGYQFGNQTVYNPWSILNCLDEAGELKPYWVNTSENILVKTLLIESTTEFKSQFELLLQEKPLEKLIDEHFVFGDLKKNPSAVWSLLLMAGYLKVIAARRTDQGLMCQLAAPNREVRNLYRQIIEQWLSNGHGVEWYNAFLQHLLNGEVELFTEELEEIVQRIVSVHDTAKYPEAFYHGLLLGLIVSLDKKHYILQSNKESGRGRYDIAIIPKDKNKLGIIIECKAAPKGSKLRTIAEQALAQINLQQYETELKTHHIKKILKLGLALRKKEIAVAHEILKN